MTTATRRKRTTTRKREFSLQTSPRLLWKLRLDYTYLEALIPEMIQNVLENTTRK